MKTQNFTTFYVLFFIFTIAFFVAPPFFLPHSNFELKEATYPASVFINFLISVFIFCFFRNLKDKRRVPNVQVISETMITVGLIFLLSATFEAILYFYSIRIGVDKVQKLIFPKSPVNIANCIFGTFFAAFFEEVLYRFYLPEQIFAFFKEKSPVFLEKRTIKIGIETLCILIFGLSHLYLGILNAIFATFSGIVLRRGFLKTNNLILIAAIHGFYNLINIVL